MAEETLVLRMIERGSAATAAGVNRVTTSVKGLATTTAAASKRAVGLGRSSRYLGRELTRSVTTPIIGVGAAAVFMNVKWTQALTNISTQTHYTAGDVARLQQPMLDLARIRPQGPQDFAHSLLELAKIGVPANQTIKDLDVASKAATIGQADLADVTGAAAAAWLSGIQGGKDFTNVVKLMTAASGVGNVSLQQFTRAMGTGVLPVAKLAGLNIRDVFGALALLTDEGYQGSSSMAQLGTSLHFLYAPSKKAEEALGGIGLSGTQLSEDMRKPQGLLTALTDLHDHLGMLPGGAGGTAAQQTLGAIFPASRGKVLMTLLNQLDRYQQKLEQVDEVQGRFGGNFDKQMTTPINRLKTAWSSIQVDLIMLGSDILPPVAVGIGFIATQVDLLIQGFHKLDPTQKTVILGFLGILAVVGPLLISIGTLVLVIGALMDPVVLAIAALVLLGGALFVAYHKFQLVHDAVDLLWDVFSYSPLGMLIKHFGDIIHLIAGMPRTIASTATGMWDGLKTGLTAALNWIIDQINKVTGFKIFGHQVGVKLGHVGEGGGGGSGGGGAPPPGGNPVFPSTGAAPRRSTGRGSGETGRGPFAPPNVLLQPDFTVHSTIVLPNGDVLGRAVSKSNRSKRSKK
jgi:TP901 family phage tail tape measure protein